MAPDPRQDVVAAIDAVLAVEGEFRRILDIAREGLEQMRIGIGQGRSMLAVARQSDVGMARKRIVEQWGEFEQARHHLRLACFRLAIAEGASIEELADTWGYSPTLAERFVRQALGGRLTSRGPST